jgi:hypothetical protein
MSNFEVCAYLFEFKSTIPDFERGKAKILPSQYVLPDTLGKQEYMEYFED